MAVHNDSRSGRILGPHAANQPRTHSNSRPNARKMSQGDFRRRRLRPAPEAMFARLARRKGAGGTDTAAGDVLRAERDETSRRIPAVVELAIYCERDSLITAMTVLYGLHSILCRAVRGDHSEPDKDVENATKWADSTVLTSMLLVRLHNVIRNLEKIADGKPDVDRTDVSLADGVRP